MQQNAPYFWVNRILLYFVQLISCLLLKNTFSATFCCTEGNRLVSNRIGAQAAR